MIGGSEESFGLVATVDVPGATSQAGEVIALVLPADIAISELFAPANVTRTSAVEPAADNAKAMSQMEAVSSLLQNARAGNSTTPRPTASAPRRCPTRSGSSSRRSPRVRCCAGSILQIACRNSIAGGSQWLDGQISRSLILGAS